MTKQENSKNQDLFYQEGNSFHLVMADQAAGNRLLSVMQFFVDNKLDQEDLNVISIFINGMDLDMILEWMDIAFSTKCMQAQVNQSVHNQTTYIMLRDFLTHFLGWQNNHLVVEE